MGKFVGISIVLFVLAAGFVILTQGAEMAALIDAFRAEPLLHKIAWAVIVLVPLLMLPFAVWQFDTLVRQRLAARTLEQRLDGVRQGVKGLAKSQTDAEADLHRLARTDPEDAIGALQRRLTEAERYAQVQQNRNEIGDLNSRVSALRARLAPVLDTRRSIEQTFAELDGSQSDIERSLAEVATGDDGVALDIRLKNLTEFVRQSNFRCDQIEHGSKTVAALKEACAELQARLAPLTAAQDGITSRTIELAESRDRLGATIDALERTPDGALADRVEKFAEDKKKLDDDVLRLTTEFAKLSTLRKDVGMLTGAFDHALNMLSVDWRGSGAAEADARLDELTRFIEQTQSQFEDIERRVVEFGQLKAKLDELQARLVPLESEESGVAKLLGDLQDIRDRLVVKIRRIEGGEQGDLAARVKMFAQTKKELEDRVLSLSDQFTRLATVRKDIAGLFEKLNTAIRASSS